MTSAQDQTLESRESSASHIFDCIRQLQKRNRFVGQAYGFPLSLTEAHLLIEISANKNLTTTALAELLGLERSSISRAIKGLNTRGFLDESAVTHDKRRRELALSAKGRSILEPFDARANANAEQFAAVLDPNELSRLTRYVCGLCNALGAKPSPLRAGELEMRRETRRMTRVFGILGQNFLQSVISSTQWQILFEISSTPRGVTAAALCQSLSMQTATMSSQLKRLMCQGFLSRTQSSADRREYLLEIASKGRALLSKLAKQGETLIIDALRSESDESIRDFARLFSRYVSASAPRVVKVLQEQVRVERVLDSAQKRGVRAYLLEELVKRKLHLEAPEVIGGRGSELFGLYSGDTLSGVSEFQKINRGWECSCCLISEKLDSDTMRNDFISAALATLPQ